jgi:hypothetical protein
VVDNVEGFLPGRPNPDAVSEVVPFLRLEDAGPAEANSAQQAAADPAEELEDLTRQVFLAVPLQQEKKGHVGGTEQRGQGHGGVVEQPRPPPVSVTVTRLEDSGPVSIQDTVHRDVGPAAGTRTNVEVWAGQLYALRLEEEEEEKSQDLIQDLSAGTGENSVHPTQTACF